MKKQFRVITASMLAVTMAVSLSACSGGRQEAETTTEKAATEAAVTAAAAASDSTETADSTAAEAAGGFEADATIGVSLPWLGTQNWQEANDMFKAQLEAAGFKTIIQAADNKVPQQQQQIESMIQNGVKVIVVGPIDGSQLGAVLEEAEAAGISVIGYDRTLENTTEIGRAHV